MLVIVVQNVWRSIIVNTEPTMRIDIYRNMGGGRRPYADTTYDYNIVFSNWWESTTGPRKGNWCPDEAHVKAIAKLFIKHFEDNPTYALEPYLLKIEKIKSDTWHLIILEPYCD